MKNDERFLVETLVEITESERVIIAHYILTVMEDFQVALKRLRAERKRTKTKAIDRHIDYYDHGVKAFRYALGSLQQRKTLKVKHG